MNILRECEGERRERSLLLLLLLSSMLDINLTKQVSVVISFSASCITSDPLFDANHCEKEEWLWGRAGQMRSHPGKLFHTHTPVAVSNSCSRLPHSFCNSRLRKQKRNQKEREKLNT